MGRTKEVSIALSLANLCFLREWAVILKPSNWFYINVDLISLHLIALILNVLLLAAAFYLGLVLARNSRRAWAMNFARWAFLGVLIVLLNAARELAGLNFWEFLFDRPGYWRFLLDYDWYFVVARFALCSLIAFGLLQWKNPVIRLAGLLAFIAIILSPFFVLVTLSESVLFSALALVVLLQWQNQVVRLGARTILILSPFVLMTFSQTMWGLAKAQSFIRDNPIVKQVHGEKDPKVRVLWLIFDGLDQRITFADRPPTLDLPELDRLRTQSFYATNAYSPAVWTNISIPALLTGQLLSKVKTISTGEVFITPERTGKSVRLSTHPNIFSAAIKAGYNTGLVSATENWHLLFRGHATMAFEDNFNVEHPYSEIISIIAYQTYRLLPLWNTPRQTRLLKKLSNQGGINVFQRTLYNAKKCVQAPDLGFIFVYFVLPHRPYIYDRWTKNFVYDYKDTPEGYLDNLALVDRVVGELRSVMEQAGSWESTSVILSSDHHWRSSKLFDGKINERWIPFLVKFPGQKEGVVYEHRFNTIITYDMVLALLNREISRPHELVQWLVDQRL